MESVLAAACLIGCLIWGFILGRLSKKPKIQSLGTLQIDHSDPDMPYLFLLDYDLDYIATKKQATFEVKVEDFVSQD